MKTENRPELAFTQGQQFFKWRTWYYKIMDEDITKTVQMQMDADFPAVKVIPTIAIGEATPCSDKEWQCAKDEMLDYMNKITQRPSKESHSYLLPTPYNIESK